MEISKHGYINLLHILIIAPALFYVYYLAVRKELQPLVCIILGIIGIIGFISHIILYIYKILKKKECYLCWANLIHIFLVFPLFMYIGYYCAQTERKYYEMLLLITIAALGYHIQGFIRYEILKIQ